VVLSFIAIAVVAIFAMMAMMFVGCGKKGPLRPLGEPLPQAPGSIQIEQRGGALNLSWHAPEKNEDGSPVKLTGFRIYRLPFTPQNECPECRDDDHLWREVAVDDSAVVNGSGAFRLYDDQVEPGQGYRYRVEPVTDSGFPGASAQVSRVVMAPSPAPGSIVAVADHTLIHLSWTAVEDSTGGELLGYQVFRAMEIDEADGVGAFAEQPINRDPLAETAYEDSGLTNGVTYRYRVSAVWKHGEVVVVSDWSETVSVTPRSAFR
jgi:hypothetical protein